MRKLITGIIIVVIFYSYSSANATVSCASIVYKEYTDKLGNVAVYIDKGNNTFGWVKLCNSITSWSSIPTDVCQKWSNDVSSALITELKISIYYANAWTDCNQIVFGLSTTNAPYSVGIYP
ncbi:MAG: hypothetical protein ACYDBT_02280 [Desulfobulbaceae bacterium]